MRILQDIIKPNPSIIKNNVRIQINHQKIKEFAQPYKDELSMARAAAQAAEDLRKRINYCRRRFHL